LTKKFRTFNFRKFSFEINICIISIKHLSYYISSQTSLKISLSFFEDISLFSKSIKIKVIQNNDSKNFFERTQLVREKFCKSLYEYNHQWIARAGAFCSFLYSTRFRFDCNFNPQFESTCAIIDINVWLQDFSYYFPPFMYNMRGRMRCIWGYHNPDILATEGKSENHMNSQRNRQSNREYNINRVDIHILFRFICIEFQIKYSNI
jgi:hypothetical protein